MIVVIVDICEETVQLDVMAESAQSDASWTINRTVLIHVDRSCSLCSPLGFIANDSYQLSTVHLIILLL